MEIRVLDHATFLAFSKTSSCENFYQSECFTAMKEKEGWKSYYLGGYENDTLCAATIILSTPMYQKYEYCIAVKGFLLDYANVSMVKQFTSALCAYLKSQNGLYLRINPAFFVQELDSEGAVVVGGYDHHAWIDTLCACGFTHEGFTRGFQEDSHVRYLYVMNIANRTIEDIRKGMSKLTQRNIKTAQKCHIEIHEISEASKLPNFLDVIEHTAKRRNFHAFDQAYYEDMFHMFTSEHVKFLYATFEVKAYLDDLEKQIHQEQATIERLQQRLMEGENEKTAKKLTQSEDALVILHKKQKEAQEIQEKHGDSFILASANFILYGSEITYFHGGSYAEYMHYCAQFALQWHMIQYAAEHGYTRFNMNGISGVFDESAPDYGVYTFKKGFGGHVEEYAGYFHMPLQKRTYQMLRAASKLKSMVKKGDA